MEFENYSIEQNNSNQNNTINTYSTNYDLDGENHKYFQENENQNNNSTAYLNQESKPNIYNHEKQKNIIIPKKSYYIKKKQKQSINSENLIKYTQLLYPNLQNRKIFKGVSITQDGLLRFCFSLSSVSFGYSQELATQVEDNHNLKYINIHLVPDYNQPTLTIEEALQVIRLFPNINYNEIQDSLKNYSKIILNIQKKIRQLHLSQKMLRQYEEGFNEYIIQCYEYLKQYVLNKPEQMYQFTIGRVNFQKEDFEIVRYGYSNSYLNLLGVNEAQFQQIILRQQKIDLISSQQDVILQSLKGLSLQRGQIYVSEITTFDGYQLKLQQKKKSIQFPLINTVQFDNISSHIFCITEIDVGLEDLQGLIKYRQKLTRNSRHLTIDEYLKIELSFLFENVEYSVQSQNFLEKYYEENVKQLIQKQNEIIKLKVCEYKLIN